MADNTTYVQAPPEAVFEVLRDPPSYLLWVVGSQHLRGVDADWPAVGSKLYHTVGFGPLQDHDTTEVLEIDPPHRLVLEARAWPFGTAKVEISLSAHGDGTTLHMRETPLHGPAVRFDNRLIELAINLRNTLSLRRLCRWAEERHRGTPGHRP